MPASQGAQILAALQTRLESITTAAGYRTTVKLVRLNHSEPTLNAAPTDCPLIEIMNEQEVIDHEQAGAAKYWSNQFVILWIVAERDKDDAYMEDLLQDINKALYGNSANASGNTGMNLGGLVQEIRLVDTTADINLIPSARVYQKRIMLRSIRRTYGD